MGLGECRTSYVAALSSIIQLFIMHVHDCGQETALVSMHDKIKSKDHSQESFICVKVLDMQTAA